jgi:hypothetical protein
MKGTGLLGENLIFLVSQPRAGSTLLQRILGRHREIHTIAEPWLMLPPLYAMKPDGYQAEFDWSLAWRANQDLINALPKGDRDYLEGLRRMYSFLYGRLLNESGKRLFLDKTPRYHLILPELHQLFPRARFIILIRNPLAVLCSLINTWSIFMLYQYKNDLLKAPGLLIEGIQVIGKRAFLVNYETFLSNPGEESKRICDWLEIEYNTGMLDYASNALLQDLGFGDKIGISQHNRPEVSNVYKWVSSLDHPQIWRLAHEYLIFLGENVLAQMGYSYNELMSTLDAQKPSALSRLATISLLKLLQKQVGETSRMRRAITRFSLSINRKGILSTALSGIRRIPEWRTLGHLSSSSTIKSKK